MKALFLLFVFGVFIFSNTFSQEIENGGFETWTNGNPVGWDTSNEDIAMFGVAAVTADTQNPKEGTTALMAKTTATAFFSLSGIVCNGFYEGPNPVNGEVETIKGEPFTSRANALELWYKCLPMPADSALFAIHFFKAGELIGKGEFVQKDTIAEWTSLNIPILWNSEEFPDTMLILMKSSYGTTNQRGNAVAGSSIWVDALMLQNVTGLNQINQRLARVYPNPFHHELHIDLKSGSEAWVSIYDISGKKVISKQISHSERLNTQFLKNGFYVLAICLEGETERLKLNKN
jgi:hypothetical protein